MRRTTRFRPHRFQRRALLLEALEHRTLLAADIAPVLDIRTIQGNLGLDSNNFTQVGDTLYFKAYTLTAGEELWKTDGTASGTKIVK